MFRPRTFAVLLLSLACVSRVGAASPYDALLKHAPSNTNALVLIDIKRVYASPLAKKENWAERVRQNGHGGLGFFPSDSELAAVAAEINLTSMVRDLQVGSVRVKNMPNFGTLAAQENGSVDDIAGQLAVFSPRNVYFTGFTGDIFAAIYPADRQYVARWLKADRAGKLPPLSPYLRKATDNAGENTVTIALDLEDVVDPRVLQFGLGTSPVMAKNRVANLNNLAVFLSRAKGLTFAAKLGDRVEGTITIEFPDTPSRYKSVMKDLFLEVIDAYGISIAGLDQWEAAFVGNTMTLSGSMSGDDLKRVVSLFAFPRPDMQTSAGGMEKAQKEPNAAATRRYLAAVETILDEIKRVKENKNYDKTATWHEKSALQIEQLSHRNVDPLAIDAAYQAASKLRAIASSLRGVPIDVKAASQKAYVYSERYPYYWWGRRGGGWWGGFRQLAFAPSAAQTNIPQVEGEIAKIIADDQKQRIATWTQIDELMSDMRRKLRDKYKMEF